MQRFYGRFVVRIYPGIPQRGTKCVLFHLRDLTSCWLVITKESRTSLREKLIDSTKERHNANKLSEPEFELLRRRPGRAPTSSIWHESQTIYPKKNMSYRAW